MTSYDRYLGYIGSPPLHHHHHHHRHYQCQQHLRQQSQQLDETDVGTGWRTSGFDGPCADVNRAAAVGRRHQAASPTTATVQANDDGCQRRPAPPAFSIDAILSGTATTANGLAVSTSGAEWSRLQSAAVQQLNTSAGYQPETAAQLIRGRGLRSKAVVYRNMPKVGSPVLDKNERRMSSQPADDRSRKACHFFPPPRGTLPI